MERLSGPLKKSGMVFPYPSRDGVMSAEVILGVWPLQMRPLLGCKREVKPFKMSPLFPLRMVYTNSNMSSQVGRREHQAAQFPLLSCLISTL